MEEDIKKSYEELKKKYSLPSFDILNSELEISSLESADFLLRRIKEKIAEKLDYIAHLLEAILHPDTNSLADMHEYRGFTETDKKEIFEIYGKLMILHRTAIELFLESNDTEIVAYINTVFEKLPELKKSTLKYIKKLRTTWGKQFDSDDELGYLG